MKIRQRPWSWRLLALLSVMLALSACGFTGNLRSNPGFASFNTPSTLRSVDRQFGISLGPIPLRLATMMSRPVLDDEDEWISDSLKAVRAVRVYVYALEGENERVADHLSETSNSLIADGWEQIAAVREDGELVNALVKHETPDVIRGIVVMVEEDEELVLVNVIGKIRPESFNTIMEKLEIEFPHIEIEDASQGAHLQNA